MSLPGSENRTAHALSQVAIQVITLVDCFTPHELTYLLVGRMVGHEGHVSSFINKCKKIRSFLPDHNLLKQLTFVSLCVCSDVLFTQTQRDSSIQISFHKKNHNATWVRIASFWKEAVLFKPENGYVDFTSCDRWAILCPIIDDREAPAETKLPPFGTQRFQTHLLVWVKSSVLWYNFHWNMFLWIHLARSQCWFRLWLGAEQSTSHYLNQWWPNLDNGRYHRSPVPAFMAPINKARGKRRRIPRPSSGARERAHFTPSSSKRLLKIVPPTALLNTLFFTVRWTAFHRSNTFIFLNARRINMRISTLSIITLIFLRLQIMFISN